MRYDPYDPGIPRHKSPRDIYDGLTEMSSGEEINILSTMFSEVSWDGQNYYYIDKGCDLLEKFDSISDYGEKMWLLDLAVLQMDGDEIHDTIYEALCNPDLARKLNFRQLFIQHMLLGDGSHYKKVSTDYLYELQECSNFCWQNMVSSFMRVQEAYGIYGVYPLYNNFCDALIDKVGKLQLHQEAQLIAECRAVLTSYDDFMFGLRANQALYEAQERQYQQKVARLQESYENRVKLLYLVAQNQGIVLDKNEVMKLLEAPIQ